MNFFASHVFQIYFPIRQANLVAKAKKKRYYHPFLKPQFLTGDRVVLIVCSRERKCLVALKLLLFAIDAFFMA